MIPATTTQPSINMDTINLREEISSVKATSFTKNQIS
jgi:hypothetical protein